jgi:hypothetical protein
MMGRDFCAAVKLLRALSPRHQLMCLFAAQNWDEAKLLEEIAAAEMRADEPPGVRH